MDDGEDLRRKLEAAGISDEDASRMIQDIEGDESTDVVEDQGAMEMVVQDLLVQARLTTREDYDIESRDGRVVITLEAQTGDSGYPLSQVLDFANRLASQNIGHDVRISAQDDQVLLYFTTLER